MRRGGTGFAALMLIIAVAIASPAAAKEALQEQVVAKLREAGPGTRFGLVVADEDGRELIAIAPEDRFIPASNTKIFTTAAAFATLPKLEEPDSAGGTEVRLEANGGGVTDVVLVGKGDARLSSASDCVGNCLAVLADAIAAKTRRVRNVVGDGSLFPDERWSPGMSWNNIPTRSGTAMSALSLDDNELRLNVTPSSPGKPPAIEGPAYYIIENHAITSGGPTNIEVQRLPNSKVARITGTIAAADAKPELIRLGIDDPAHYAAWRFKELLQARGVRVTGDVSARHRRLTSADDPKLRNGAPAPRPPEQEPLARLIPPPLIEDVSHINKVSQNLHAELLLRRVGRVTGSGSIADGVSAIGSMLERAGVKRTHYDFSDGSGMSTYNRVAPRGMVVLLRWIAAQPWGAAYRATLPIAGVDGTLANRFRKTPLERRLFAKTGTLNATNALSGYLVTKSGRTLTFSAYANDVPGGGSATKYIDAALQLIAETN